MGIEDRAYIRNSGRGGGLTGRPGGLSMWSANTWIIVVCVAVFVADGLIQKVAPGWSLPVVEKFVWIAEFEDKVDLDVAERREIQDGSGTYHRQYWANGHHVASELVFYQPPFRALLQYSTNQFLKLEFWRLIGFQFLHANTTHILFNMMGLYFFGPMVEKYLGSKRYLAFYLLCGIFGALMYTLLNIAGWVTSDVMNITVPGVLITDSHTPLVGASAGVFGVLMAGAFLAPNARVLVFFFLPMPLRVLAYGLVVMSLFTVLTSGENAGGEAGHLGGAIAGFYFIRHPRHLHDFFDLLGRADPTSHHYRQGGGAKQPKLAGQKAAGPSVTEIDRILVKVQSQGLHSLTAKERKALKAASDRQ